MPPLVVGVDVAALPRGVRRVLTGLLHRNAMSGVAVVSRCSLGGSRLGVLALVPGTTVAAMVPVVLGMIMATLAGRLLFMCHRLHLERIRHGEHSRNGRTGSFGGRESGGRTRLRAQRGPGIGAASQNGPEGEAKQQVDGSHVSLRKGKNPRVRTGDARELAVLQGLHPPRTAAIPGAR